MDELFEQQALEEIMTWPLYQRRIAVIGILIITIAGIIFNAGMIYLFIQACT